jgi:hypothetical protein
MSLSVASVSEYLIDLRMILNRAIQFVETALWKVLRHPVHWRDVRGFSDHSVAEIFVVNRDR